MCCGKLFNSRERNYCPESLQISACKAPHLSCSSTRILCGRLVKLIKLPSVTYSGWTINSAPRLNEDGDCLTDKLTGRSEWGLRSPSSFLPLIPLSFNGWAFPPPDGVIIRSYASINLGAGAACGELHHEGNGPCIRAVKGLWEQIYFNVILPIQFYSWAKFESSTMDLPTLWCTSATELIYAPHHTKLIWHRCDWTTGAPNSSLIITDYLNKWWT